ncbi:hypothetical protein GALL_464810 [mine drainage metagenome]|uniref:Uncharacterized protein n=1 Tax=mine drainage metagenome TaxID=410659 RepID=A0A1J5PK63_9ZZZZ
MLGQGVEARRDELVNLGQGHCGAGRHVGVLPWADDGAGVGDLGVQPGIDPGMQDGGNVPGRVVGRVQGPAVDQVAQNTRHRVAGGCAAVHGGKQRSAGR